MAVSVHAVQKVAKSGAHNCSSNNLQLDRPIATFQSVFLSLLYSLHTWRNIPDVSVKPGLFLKITIRKPDGIYFCCYGVTKDFYASVATSEHGCKLPL
jgi:hypothetical protein